MKTRSRLFCVVAMLCFWAGNLPAQDNVPQPPGYGGGMRDNVSLAPEYGYGMGGVMDDMLGMPMGGVGVAMPGDEEDLTGIGARCLLKIFCDPSNLRLDERMMRHLWFSTGVLNKAYREVLDANCPMGLDISSGHVSLIGCDTGTVMYSVGVSYIGEKEKEILAAAVDNLKSALTKLADQERDRLKDQLVNTIRRCDEMENQVAEKQNAIREITQEGVTNQKEIQEKISGLKNGMADIQMRLQYSGNRIDELRKQKVELQSTIERALVSDAVTEELKNIVKGSEESLSLVEKMFSTGRIPADKVQEAKEKLARAKIELARRMEEVGKNAGQDKFSAIDGKIVEATSQISELGLGYNFKKQEYDRIKELLAKSDALELQTMKLDAAKKTFYEMLSLQENLRNQLVMQRSLSVSVIGMD